MGSEKKHFKSRHGISSGVWAVSIAMMLISVSTAMTFSITPFYITEVLGIGIVSLGWIEGFTEALSQFSKLVSGYTGDFFRRKKPPLMTGVIMAMISKPLFILAQGQGMLIFSKVIERISNGIMATPRDAYCAEEGPVSKRGASLGLMMSLKTLGITIGSFIIGGLMFFTDDYLVLLWIGFIPCCLSIVVLWRYMHEKSSDNKIKKHKRRNLRLRDFKALNNRYWSLVFAATLFMCARFSDCFVILRMAELGAHKSLCSMTVGIFNLVSVFACLPIGTISDRFDRSRILYAIFVALALSNVCFIYAESIYLALVGVVLWGLQRGPSQMLFAAIIADEVPEKIIGTALGIYYLLTGVAVFVAGLCAGYFADAALKYAFVFGMMVSFVSMAFLFVRNELLSHRNSKIAVQQ